MKTEYRGWMMTIPVISTGHFTSDSIDDIRAMAEDSADCNGLITAARYAEGYFIRFDEEKNPPRMSADIAEVRNWALNAGFLWIRVDCDGDRIALTEYNW